MFLLCLPGAQFTGSDVCRCRQLRNQDGLSWLSTYPEGFLPHPLLYGAKVWSLWGLRLWGGFVSRSFWFTHILFFIFSFSVILCLTFLLLFLLFLFGFLKTVNMRRCVCVGISLHYDLTYKVRWTAFKPHFQFFLMHAWSLLKNIYWNVSYAGED